MLPPFVNPLPLSVFLALRLTRAGAVACVMACSQEVVALASPAVDSDPYATFANETRSLARFPPPGVCVPMFTSPFRTIRCCACTCVFVRPRVGSVAPLSPASQEVVDGMAIGKPKDAFRV